MRLLIIGSQDQQISVASAIAKSRGAKVAVVPTVEAALDALRSGRGADLVMIDIRQNIKAFIEHLNEERISVPVVACGIKADAEAAAAAIKAGAKEYVPLPPDETLIAAILEAITEESSQFLYEAPAVKKLMDLALQIAPSDASILITGESGTGKEVMAQFIHQKSKRATQPFIAVNCAAIPENLLESEMFGHEKGAFTGAVARRVGKFEEANGGTLLLDEISEMDSRLQAKLLRAIQEKEIDRVGGSRPVKLNVRILATSNRNLHEEVKKGTFREDLFFRLNIFNLHLPPLRERKDDIKLLAKHFIEKYAKANGVPVKPLLPEALKILEGYHWPGNVRELENTLHRAVLLSSGDTIGKEAIMLTTYGEQGPGARESDGNEVTAFVGRTMESVEQELILGTLQHCLGNRTHSAHILGISIRTLRNKLKEYGEKGLEVPPAA